MDIDLTPTPTKIPNIEIDTPPHTTQPTKPLSTLKNHRRRHYERRPPSAAAAVAYKQCMKNHAAAIGGHAVDGCGEFMPSPPSSATDPTSLTCAACGCHRNFHRRDPDSPTSAIAPPFLDFRHPPLPERFSLSPTPPSPPPPVPYGRQVFFSLSSAVAAEDRHQAPVTPTVENPAGRKRSRTKFSQEQKEKMHSFSVKLGWKMQKCDEAAVKEFCHEIGVSKGVLKVWMHNNKNTFGKKEIDGDGGGGSDSGGGRISEERNGNDFKNDNGNGVHLHGFNASPSPASCDLGKINDDH